VFFEAFQLPVVRHVDVAELPGARCHDNADDVVTHDVTAADLRPHSATSVWRHSAVSNARIHVHPHALAVAYESYLDFIILLLVSFSRNKW